MLLFLLFAFPRTGATAWCIVIAPAEYAAKFQPLAALRAAEGLTVDVVALESIPATDGAAGDPAARLRAYLQAAYAGGTRYVLLGGDATTSPA